MTSPRQMSTLANTGKEDHSGKVHQSARRSAGALFTHGKPGHPFLLCPNRNRATVVQNDPLPREMMRYNMQPGDHLIRLRSPGRSFLTGCRVTQIPAIVVRVCPPRIKIKVLLDAREKTANVDPDNLICCQEIKNQRN
jgi:hypothetical protein